MRALDVLGQKEKENYALQGSTPGQAPACGEQKGEPTVGRGRNVSWCPSTAGSHVASLGQGQQQRQTSNQRVEGETQSIWLLQITASRKLLAMSISRRNARMQAAVTPSAPPICQVSGTCHKPLKVKFSNCEQPSQTCIKAL